MWVLFFSFQVNTVEAGAKCVLSTRLYPATNVIPGMYRADPQAVSNEFNDWCVLALLR